MIDLIKNVLFASIHTRNIYKSYYGSKYHDHMLLSEMIRNVHSIEKGMCIRNPRNHFGMKKIDYLMTILSEYVERGFNLDRDELKMSIGALQSYVQFHENDRNEDVLRIEHFCEVMTEKLNIEDDCKKYGGYHTIVNDGHNVEDQTLKEVILNRHSVRDFSDEPVNNADIMKAVELANHCPSACNRQTTSVYILDKMKIQEMSDWLSGIGGFANDVNKFLLITGRSSAFNAGEAYQYLVSAGIFVGYLTLCLSDQGIGACVVQRPLLSAPSWKRLAKENGIPGDEELVCMIAIGTPKNDFRVPISHRLGVKDICKEL